MMKRSVLVSAIALSILASSAANAAQIYNKDGNKLDFYGKVSADHLFSKDTDNDGDQTTARIGWKGETQINDWLTGYGQWEYNINASHDEAQGTTGSKTRLAFAGLKFKDYGSIDFGRNYGVVYDVESYTDMLPEYGGDSYSYGDNFMNVRATNLATYRNKNFFGLVDGLNVALQYQGSNQESGRAVNKQNGTGFGLSADYQNIGGTGIGFAAAYSDSNRTTAQKQAYYSNGKDKASTWTTALKYDANQVYLAAMYAETRNATPLSTSYTDPATQIKSSRVGAVGKTQNVEVVAQYQFENGLRPSLGYVQSKGKDIEGYGDADLVKYFEVGVTYYFNKNMYTYVDYKINRLSDNNKLGLATDDVTAVNLTYRF